MTLTSRLSRSPKVIGTDTDRSATNNLLLRFHSNNGPISYRFRDKRQHRSKFAKFSNPVYLTPPMSAPLGIGYRRLGSKTSMMGQPGRERSLTMSSAVWIQYTNVTDGRTDGRTDTGRQQRRRLRIASARRPVKTVKLCLQGLKTITRLSLAPPATRRRSWTLCIDGYRSVSRCQ